MKFWTRRKDEGKITFYFPCLQLFNLCLDSAQPSLTTCHPCVGGFTWYDCWEMMQSTSLVNENQKCLTCVLLLIVPVSYLKSSKGFGKLEANLFL